MSDVIMYTLYKMYQVYGMRLMATMYTKDATVVVYAKALYTCATLYPEAKKSTKETSPTMQTVYTKYQWPQCRY